MFTRQPITESGCLGTSIDLNHDGIVDFTLAASYSDNSGGWDFGLGVQPSQRQNAIVGNLRHSHTQVASALPVGARVGKARAFVTAGSMAGVRYRKDSNPSYTFKGPWANGGKGIKNHYLGLKFFVKGKVHYGWARLNVVITNNRLGGTLTGYAYETIPGKSIIAGQTKGPDDNAEAPSASGTAPTRTPATLGILAMGAPALSVWLGLAQSEYSGTRVFPVPESQRERG